MLLTVSDNLARMGDLLTGVASVGLVILGVVAALGVYRQLRAATVARQVTIVSDYYEWFRSPEAEQAKKIVERENTRACGERFKGLPDEDDRLLRSYLGHHEYLAILAYRKIAAADLLRPLLGRASYEAWESGLVFIARRRAAPHRAHYARHLERVLDSWISSKKKRAREWRDCYDIPDHLPRCEGVVLGSSALGDLGEAHVELIPKKWSAVARSALRKVWAGRR